MEAGRVGDVPPRLVLYDGVCVVCNRTVQRLLALDREGRLRFAPIQGSTAAEVWRRHPEMPLGLDSIVYVESSNGSERVSWWSEAVLRIAADLGIDSWPLRLARHVPRRCVDLGYRLFARMRYRLFGKFAVCPVPTAEQRARFLP